MKDEVNNEPMDLLKSKRLLLQETLITQKRLDTIVPEDHTIFQHKPREDMDILMNQFQTILGEQDDLGDLFEKEANEFYEPKEEDFNEGMEKLRAHLKMSSGDVDFLDFADFIETLGQKEKPFELYNDDSDYQSDGEIDYSVYFDEQEDLRRFGNEIDDDDDNDELHAMAGDTD